MKERRIIKHSNYFAVSSFMYTWKAQQANAIMIVGNSIPQYEILTIT
jgi:hypothetical protein